VHADSGYHDDLVMAWAIAGAGLQHRPTPLPKRPPRRQIAQPAGSNLAG